MERFSDPMLIAMFDGLYRELAAALEHRHLGTSAAVDPQDDATIARLTHAIEGVEEALVRPVGLDVE